MFAALIGGTEILMLALLLLALVLGLALFAFWIWMLVHAIQNKGLTDGEKIGWVLAIVFLPFIGSVLYFFIGKPKAKLPPPTSA
jgi:hypothetical protein